MYVFDAASPEEIIQIEKWRKEYPEINTEVITIEMAMESYAMANAVIPSSSVKNKIFESLKTYPSVSSAAAKNLSAVKT